MRSKITNLSLQSYDAHSYFEFQYWSPRSGSSSWITHLLSLYTAGLRHSHTSHHTVLYPPTLIKTFCLAALNIDSQGVILNDVITLLRTRQTLFSSCQVP